MGSDDVLVKSEALATSSSQGAYKAVMTAKHHWLEHIRRDRPRCIFLKPLLSQLQQRVPADSNRPQAQASDYDGMYPGMDGCWAVVGSHDAAWQCYLERDQAPGAAYTVMTRYGTRYDSISPDIELSFASFEEFVEAFPTPSDLDGWVKANRTKDTSIEQQLPQKQQWEELADQPVGPYSQRCMDLAQDLLMWVVWREESRAL